MATNWSQTIEKYLAEGRTVSGGKYDDSKKAADAQLATNNANSSAALAQQNKFNTPVYQSLIKYLQGNGQGFSPEQMALLNSQFLNQNSQQFNSAGSNVRNALLSRGVGGGDQPVGGNFVRGISNLEGLKGATTASGLTSIQLQNLQQALANKFNAAGIFQGTGQGYGQQALGFGGLANQNVNQIHEAFRPGFFENLGNAFAKAIPGAAIGLATGGLSGVLSGAGAAAGGIGAASGGIGGLQSAFGSGNMLGGGFTPTGGGYINTGYNFGCWIARAIFGEDDIRWMIARNKLIAWSERSLLGNLVWKLYLRFGERVSRMKWAVRLLAPAFYRLVSEA